MGIALLAKLGFAVNVFVKSGYVLAGSYFVRTGARYYRDYVNSVEQEKLFNNEVKS